MPHKLLKQQVMLAEVDDRFLIVPLKDDFAVNKANV